MFFTDLCFFGIDYRPITFKRSIMSYLSLSLNDFMACLLRHQYGLKNFMILFVVFGNIRILEVVQ